MVAPLNPQVKEELQKLNQTSPFIELFTLNATFIGGPIYRFTPNVMPDGSNISFGGHVYTPLPVTSDGWELTANGSQPRPTLTISNVSQALLASVISLGDLVNARITRLRTFAKYLDGQPEADPSKYLHPTDIYFVYQKVGHNKNQITWQLASPVEAFAQKLPGRQFLKDVGFPGISRIRGA